MPGFTEKSREYLRLAADSETKTPELHALLLELACEYLDLAEYIDDPEQWRAKLFASATAETSRDSS
jgi:hypothetical protein